MAPRIQFDFEWDPKKNAANAVKHGVSFELACTVFADPRMLSVYDGGHSSQEERWATMGICSTGVLLVVHHTFKQTDARHAGIRIISSRKATKREQAQYVE